MKAANAGLEQSRRAAINLMEESVKAREQTERGREELQLILDSSPAMIFYKDRENRFLRVNRAFAESMGLPKDQLEARSLFDLYPREQAEAFGKDDQEVIATGKPKLGIVEPMQTPAGERWVQTDKVPSRDAQGNIVGVIGFAVDITERKRAEGRCTRARNASARWPTRCRTAWMANADGGSTGITNVGMNTPARRPEQMEGWGWQSVPRPGRTAPDAGAMEGFHRDRRAV